MNFGRLGEHGRQDLKEISIKSTDNETLFALGDYYDQIYLESKALECLINAALNDHSKALLYLGEYYENGLAKLKESPRIAAAFYKKSLEINPYNEEAELKLKLIQASGHETEPYENPLEEINFDILSKDDLLQLKENAIGTVNKGRICFI